MGGVQADPVEPGGEERAAPEAREREPRPQNASCTASPASALAPSPRREREHAVLVTLDQLLEGPPVAPLGAVDERSVRIVHT